jgi:ABC-type antimicrobial peptide transport system permease subunit
MFGETLKLALRAILANPLRSFLTVLGVVIGVGAVIAMVTIGSGTTAQVTAEIAKLGTNLLVLRPGQARRGPGGARDTAQPFDSKDVAALERQMEGIRTVAPTAQRSAKAIYGNANWTTSVVGTDNRYLAARDWHISGGRMFYDSELRAGRMSCIIGATVRRKLFGSGDPIGAAMRLDKLSCRVIGVLKDKGVSTFGMDQDDQVLIPLRALQRRMAGNQDITAIYLAVQDGSGTEKVQRDVELLMRERRQISAGEEDDFNVLDMKEITSMLTGITGVLTGLLGAVAAVSLLVGGIGIMNIMLVSVTERTREIGIRLAVGAQERQVLMQFLIEATVLSLFGGLIGIVLGLGFAAVATHYLKVPLVLDPGIVLVAFLFSAAVGVVFGYFPARRAARLDPIEALRHE